LKPFLCPTLMIGKRRINLIIRQLNEKSSLKGRNTFSSFETPTYEVFKTS